MKSRIAKRTAEAQQATHVAELEKANAQLRVDLDAAWSKLMEVEHREQDLTSLYEDHKKDFETMHTSHDAGVREKAEVEETEHVKLQRF
jgi:23S rRNA A2030 N6-methylase RlmJ